MRSALGRWPQVHAIIPRPVAPEQAPYNFRRTQELKCHTYLTGKDVEVISRPDKHPPEAKRAHSAGAVVCGELSSEGTLEQLSYRLVASWEYVAGLTPRVRKQRRGNSEVCSNRLDV